MKDIKRVILLAIAISWAVAEKEGNRFHPVISYTPPLDTDDFKNWSFQATSVALNNKVVLNPNGSEKYGYMQNKWTFESTAWEMSIDFEVDYTSELAEWKKADW